MVHLKTRINLNLHPRQAVIYYGKPHINIYKTKDQKLILKEIDRMTEGLKLNLGMRIQIQDRKLLILISNIKNILMILMDAHTSLSSNRERKINHYNTRLNLDQTHSILDYLINILKYTEKM